MVVGVEDLVDPADRHFRAVRTLFPKGHVQEAERLDRFPVVTRGLRRDVVADVGDLLEFGLANGIGLHGGHLGGQFRMAPGKGDDGLALDDDGLEQIILAQSGRRRARHHGAGGVHLLHLGLRLSDDEVEALVDDVRAGLAHAPTERTPPLEKSAVGIFPDRAALEDHAPVEHEVEVAFAQFIPQSFVDVVDRVHVSDPVLGVFLQLG